MMHFRNWQKWESICTAEEPSLIRKLAVASSIAALEFFLTWLIFKSTNLYSSSFAVAAAILISLYCGAKVGILVTVVMALLADYYFIVPVGSVLDSRDGFERFFILLLIAVLFSFLGASLRFAFRQVLIERKEAQKARKEAEAALDLKEKVLALVSHDIRNPLTAIQLGVQLILNTPEKSEKHQPVLNRILRSVKHADAMIQSLLDVARIRAGKTLPLDLKYCDLCAEVALIVEEISMLECDRLKFCPGGEPLFGLWGIVGIRRVLQNLIGNAVKYGAAETPIEIRVSKKEEKACLIVHNSGPEIKPEDQIKLFEAFQRTPDSESKNQRGWGLGLALVKGIAEAHQGRVWVESSRAKGTAFVLELPVRGRDALGGHPPLASAL